MTLKKPRQLTNLQRRFCEEYVIDLNATAAYKRAGYTCKNDESASTSGYKLLRNPQIQAYISEARATRSENTQVTAERVLRELRAIAFGCVTDTVEVVGGVSKVKDSKDWSDESRASIQEVSAEGERLGVEGETVSPAKSRVKAYDKMRALEILAKHTGVSNDLDSAIATLKTFGVEMKRGGDGKFYVAT